MLEIQLSGKYTGEPREYLAGNGKGKYSVADVGTWPWVKGYEFRFVFPRPMIPLSLQLGSPKTLSRGSRAPRSEEITDPGNYNSGFSQEDMKPFPHVLKWIDRIAQRPAVKRGIGEKYQQK